MNHLLRQLGDAHRLAHVEHEHIAPLPHGAGLDHQLRRFGDGHEIAGDLRMSYGHRPTTLDLLAEQRDHRAGRTQHIAETHHGKAGLVDLMHTAGIVVEQGCGLATERLQHHLSQTLGAAHHIGRPYRLVGGDQHKMLDPGLDGRLSGVQGAEHIVQHALGNIVLDYRHMLIGCRVVNSIHLPSTHHVQQALRITNRTEDRHQLQVERLALDTPLQLLMDAVQIELAVLEQDQRGRRLGEDLPAQLGADRSARAGDHHHLATDAALEQLDPRRHRIASEQVGDIHLLDILDLDPPTGQVHEAWHAAYVQRKGLQRSQYLPPTPARSRGNRQQHLAGAGFLDHLLNVLGFVDLETGDGTVGDTAVVVDEGHRPHGLAHAQGSS
ncbi:hypothetical protein D3C84_402760 [compost metagenome]